MNDIVPAAIRRFALFRKDNATPVFEETEPISCGENATVQKIARTREDDGLTYQYRDGKFSKTLFTADAVGSPGTIKVSVAGCFEGEGDDGMSAAGFRSRYGNNR